jgi:hypothetical protein
MILKKTIGAVLICLLFTQAHAQKNYSFIGFQCLPQAHSFNPALNANNKVYINFGLGSHSLGFTHSGFRLNDLIVARPQDDSLTFDVANALSKTKDLNYMDFNVKSELLALGINSGKRYFSFTASFRFDLSFAYTHDFMQLLIEGNGQDLLGQRASLDDMGLNANTYLEFALGYNQKIGKRWKVGGRYKLLSGIANVSTIKSRLGLTTDEETYALTLDGEVDIRSSNAYAFIPQEGSVTPDLQNVLAGIKGFGNMGHSLDLGATFDATEKLKLQASVLDLGFITWKTNVQNYRRDDIEFTFEGVELRQAIGDTNYLDNLQDSISEVFKFENDKESYTRALPMRIIIGGNYSFNNVLSTGVYYFSDFSNTNYRPSIVLTGSFKLSQIFFINTNYMATTNSFLNFGAGFAIKLLGIETFVTTDNLLGLLNPGAARNAHVAAGFNLVFGKHREEKEKQDIIEI